MLDQKGNYLVTLGVVVLFIIVGSWGYYLGTKKEPIFNSLPLSRENIVPSLPPIVLPSIIPDKRSES